MRTAAVGNVTATVNSEEVVKTGLVTPTVTTSTGATSCGGARPTARDFLSRVVAWPANQVGYVNLHYSMVNPRGGKNIVTGKPYQDIDQLLSFCNSAENTNNIKDLWYCTSTQSQTALNTKGNLKAVRLKQNAMLLKAIWADIDVGNTPEHPNKHYDTQKEAWAAICKFREDNKLPQFSAVVNSGGGLHVYWISKTPMPPEVWEPYAQGLKALLLKDGIKCDAGLTTDSARILRISGTKNYKYTRLCRSSYSRSRRETMILTRRWRH
jgi:hypothetical protein